MRTPRSLAAKTATAAPSDAVRLLTGLHKLIEQARHTAAAVNVGLTFIYWYIGQRFRAKVLGGERAGYVEEVVVPVLRQLFSAYGRGFSAESPRHMLRFAEVFPSPATVSTLSRRSPALICIAHPKPDKE